ncbi:MAG: arylsulfatase A-like enzyme [Hyphomicrobiaceae bacterium]|jgi:arylsulfatase A-like enzyme
MISPPHSKWPRWASTSLLALLAVVCFLPAAPASAASGPRPNIFFIMGDDHPWPDYGFMSKLQDRDAPWDVSNPSANTYYAETTRGDGTKPPQLHPDHPRIDAVSAVNCAEVSAGGANRLSTEFKACEAADTGTPNFDWLAQRGAVFPLAYVSHARCIESFASTLTGFYTTQLDDPANGGADRIGNYLQPTGYISFGYGKIWDRGYELIGFDVGSIVRNEAEIRTKAPKDVDDRRARREYRKVTNSGDRSKSRPRKGIGALQRFFDIYYDPAVYPDANTRPPWFIWYSPRLPHAPLNTGKDFVMETRDQFGKQSRGKGPRLFGNMRVLDIRLGEIFDELESEGDLENTIIIYQNDNGYILPDSKRGKGENGYRTPFMISGPGIPPNQILPHLAIAVDLLPTIMDYACEGAPSCPSSPDWKGSTLRPIMETSTPVTGREYVFAPKIRPLKTFVRSIDGYRLMRNETGVYFLYDMYNDPNEEVNLVTTEPAIFARLKDQLDNNSPF